MKKMLLLSFSMMLMFVLGCGEQDNPITEDENKNQTDTFFVYDTIKNDVKDTVFKEDIIFKNDTIFKVVIDTIFKGDTIFEITKDTIYKVTLDTIFKDDTIYKVIIDTIFKKDTIIQKDTVYQEKPTTPETPDNKFSIVMNENTLPQYAGKKWVAVPELTDEFNSWDGNKWFKSLWNYGGTPTQMLDKNSGVSNGKLWIKATLEQGNLWFGTSRVMSKAKIKFPMYTECSMKAAFVSAYSTFWLNNGNINNRDEIDICENNPKASISSDTEMRKYTMMSQYFVVKNSNTERAHGNFDNRNLSDKNPMKGVAWNEAYHTLGALWVDAHTVQFYLNGEPAGKVTSKQPFTLEQNIIWDLWTSSDSWVGGLADKNDLGDHCKLEVDWIHTYRLVNK